MAFAPFISTTPLYKLAPYEKNNFSLAFDAVLKVFYVNDFLSGDQNEVESIELIINETRWL